MGGRSPREGIYAYIPLIHFTVQQKLTQYCEATILQKLSVAYKDIVYLSQQTLSSNNTRDDSTHGHHQMVNTKIRLIIYFAAEDGEVLYSQQQQDWELIVAQIMNSLL